MANFWEQSRLTDSRSAIDAALRQMKEQNIVKRIWDKDYTVWKNDPTEISNRLGWLDAPRTMRADVGRMNTLHDQLITEGYTHALLLGMGGSSLAPDMFSRIFGATAQGLVLNVLDSTDPGAVLHFANTLPKDKTVFIVSSKSGTTVEVHSFFKYFYNWLLTALPKEEVGKRFIAITDPSTPLGEMGRSMSFREVFENDPTIGGRYSALTFFGLVPAALIGIDLTKLLDRAEVMANQCRSDIEFDEDPHQDSIGAWLGAAIATLAKGGRDKLTLLCSKSIEPFGDWAEQLIAESLGKEGKGILPVVNEPVGLPAVYGSDRLFVHLWKQGDFGEDAMLSQLREAGHPIIQWELTDEYDLGGQFILWEFATAVMGHLMGINPFDQPNVESAKKRATAIVTAYKQTGQAPQGSPVKPDLKQLDSFLASAKPGDYIAILAYVQPTDDTSHTLADLRINLRQQTKLATTVGYGPRYLHSTGQLHKGDVGRGHFIMFTSEPPQDAPIPDEAGAAVSSMSFRVLRDAQALGDKQALEDGGRPVLHIDLGSDVLGGLKMLTKR